MNKLEILRAVVQSALDYLDDCHSHSPEEQAVIDDLKNAMRLSTLPPDPDNLNNDRASWAQNALSAFQTETGTDDDDALCDLLCDLMHWADRHDQDFNDELGRAHMHYRAETDPNESPR